MKAFLNVIYSLLVLVSSFSFNSSFAQTKTITLTGSGSWVVPTGVSSITVSCWGAGGAGGGSSSSTSIEFGGGGGGAYSSKTLTVTAGTTYYYSVGEGGVANGGNGGNSWFNSSNSQGTTLVASGGKGATSSIGGLGGIANDGYGDTKYSGGNGANGSTNSYGGGGGSSAGLAADGNSASNQTGASAPSGGGNGANGRTSTNGSGSSATLVGGGGGGSRNSSTTHSGGTGANGKITVTYAPNFAPIIKRIYSNDNFQSVIETSGGRGLVFNKPANLQVDDLMIVTILQSNDLDNGISDASAPGWAEYSGSDLLNNDPVRYRATILYKVATNEDVAATNIKISLDNTANDSKFAIGSIIAFGNVDVTGGVNFDGSGIGPFDVARGVASFNRNTNEIITATGLTTVSAKSTIVMFALSCGNNTFSNWSNSQTQLFSKSSTDNNGHTIAVATKDITSAGATGNQTVTQSASSYFGSVLMALRPVEATTQNQLPVTLTSFTAKPTPDNKVSLGWVTSTEQVNKGFRIERQAGSTNGKYEQIGFVGSKAKDGNSQNMLTYNFIDVAPKVGAASFYRLVQEDLDGKLTYTEVRVVKLNGQSVSMVFPNPSNGPVNISRTADGKKMNIQVIDQSGKIISQANNITDANYRMNIPQSGIYSIKMMYPETGEQSIQRIVVQK